MDEFLIQMDNIELDSSGISCMKADSYCTAIPQLSLMANNPRSLVNVNFRGGYPLERGYGFLKKVCSEKMVQKIVCSYHAC